MPLRLRQVIALLSAALCAPSCLAPPIPDGTLISCASDEDCPDGLVCRQIDRDSLCIDANALNQKPPSVLESTLDPADRVGAGARLIATFVVDGELLDEPVVSFGNDVMARDADTSAGDTHVYLLDIPADAVDGAFPVSAVLRDRLGRQVGVALGEGPVVIDATPPSVVDTSLNVTLRGSSASVLPDEELLAIGGDGFANVSFAVTEPLAEPPQLRLRHEDGTIEAVVASDVFGDGPAYRAEVRPQGADGVYTVLAALTDLAGNSAEVTLSSVAKDNTAPAPLDDVELASLTYVRAPLGTLADPAPRFAIATTAALRPSAGTLLRFTDRDTGNVATPLAAFDAALDADEHDLPAIDRADVFVSFVDEAGNESPRRRVAQVRWTANLRGKRAGSTLENPHRFFARDAAGPPLAVDADRDEVDGYALGYDDGDTGVVSSKPRALAARADDATTNGFAFAPDWLRGRVVSIAPFGRVDAWNGERWRTVPVSAPQGVQPYWGSASGALAFDPASGRMLMVDETLPTVLWALEGRTVRMVHEDLPFLPQTMGFDGTRTIGAAVVNDELRVFAVDGDEVIELCEPGVDCPATNVFLLRAVELDDRVLLAAYDTLRIDPRFEVTAGAISACAGECPLDDTLQLRSAVWDFGSQRFVATRHAPPALLISDDGVTFDELCGPSSTACPGSPTEMKLSADPSGVGVLAVQVDFGVMRIADLHGAPSVQVQQGAPVCGPFLCPGRAFLSPEAELSLALAPAVNAVLAFESVDPINGNVPRLLERAGAQFVEREPAFGSPTPGIRRGATLVSGVGPYGVMLVGGTVGVATASNDVFGGLLNGTQVEWVPFAACNTGFGATCPFGMEKGVVVKDPTADRLVHFTTNQTWTWTLADGWSLACGAGTACAQPDVLAAVADGQRIVALDGSSALHSFDPDAPGFVELAVAETAIDVNTLMGDPETHAVYGIAVNHSVMQLLPTLVELGPFFDPEDDGPRQLTRMSAAYDPAAIALIIACDGIGDDNDGAVDDVFAFVGARSAPQHTFDIRFSATGHPSARIDAIAVFSVSHEVVGDSEVAVTPEVFDGRAFVPMTPSGANLFTAAGNAVSTAGGGISIRTVGGAESTALTSDAIEATVHYTVLEAP